MNFRTRRLPRSFFLRQRPPSERPKTFLLVIPRFHLPALGSLTSNVLLCTFPFYYEGGPPTPMRDLLAACFRTPSQLFFPCCRRCGIPNGLFSDVLACVLGRKGRRSTRIVCSRFALPGSCTHPGSIHRMHTEPFLFPL